MSRITTHRVLDEITAPGDIKEADVKAGDRGVVVAVLDRPRPAVMVEYEDQEGQTKTSAIYSNDLTQVFEIVPPYWVEVGPRPPKQVPDAIPMHGIEVDHLTVMASYSDDEQHGIDYILYLTFTDGYKIYEREWAIEGNVKREPGKKAAKLRFLRGELYSVEEAREKIPNEVLDRLLEDS